MVSKEEYIKAQHVIEDYNVEQNKELIPEYTCICCKQNKITPIDYCCSNLITQHQGMWSSGTVELINMPYGSKLDGESYFIGICDDCIKELKRKNIIIPYNTFSKLMTY